MLAELSITTTKLASCSAANHPGIKPLVTGSANIKTKEIMKSILKIRINNF